MSRLSWIAAVGLFLFQIMGPVLGDHLSLEFEKATSDEGRSMRRALLNSGRFQHIVKHVNLALNLPEPILVTFDDGDDGSTYYDPEEVEIVMEYSFFTEADELLKDQGIRNRETRFRRTLQVAEFFFYHELGHALIDTLDLPVVGREEDAADALAAYIILEIMDEPEIALAAALQFLLESEAYDQSEEDSFYDEHSLDRQRFYNIVAWVYGSDPELQEEVIDELVPDNWWDDRADVAIEEYKFMAESWEKLLESTFRK
jgi:putative metallopeptidase DUF4344